jgi:acyl-coenzyme A thioesterase PaaI-like protein
MANLDPSRLLSWWRRLSPRPGGRLLFSFLLGRGVRYTGSIAPRVLALAPGRVVVRMRDRAAVRNHLRSVHAVALANLAEASSGLALLAGLPPDARAILVGLSIDYLKKARGTLTSECDFPPVTTAEPRELEVASTIRDAAGDVVARGRARWKIGPAR